MADFPYIDEVGIVGEAALTYHPTANSEEVAAIRNEREHGLPRARPWDQSVCDQFAANRAKRAATEAAR